MHWIYDIVMHLDRHLNDLARDHGKWTYLILFAVIFCETGLVVTPFLPGDSLLFAVGALTATRDSPLGLWEVFLLLLAAAVLGNTVNYHIGRFIGPRASQHDGRFIKKKYMDRTHAFFARHGGMTIVLTRFVPIVRTFAPFVAGIGEMPYLRFQAFNVGGGLAWVGLLMLGGYLFGNLPVVKDHFSLVTVGIIVVSCLPMIFEFWQARREFKQDEAKEQEKEAVR